MKWRGEEVLGRSAHWETTAQVRMRVNMFLNCANGSHNGRRQGEERKGQRNQKMLQLLL